METIYIILILGIFALIIGLIIYLARKTAKEIKNK
jgi:hypothetical protein